MKYSAYYNHIQPYAEAGYYIADMFLKKYTWHTEVFNGIPFCTGKKSCRICYDLKLENLRYKNRKRPIPCDRELVMVDTDSFAPTEYYEIDRLVSSIAILFSELYRENCDWDVEAFQYGFSMRAPELAHLVFLKIYARNIKIKKRLYKHIKINPFIMKLIQIKQNYVCKYMSELGFDFDKYNSCGFEKAFNEVNLKKCPKGIKISLHEYLAKYSVNVSICKGDTGNFFVYLYELYKVFKSQQNKKLSKWFLETLIKMTKDENNLKILHSEVGEIKNYEEIEEIENPELYAVLSQNSMNSISVNTLLSGKYNKTFIDEILWIVFYGYSWDKETSANIIELMDICYNKNGKTAITECVDFIDRLIEIFLNFNYVHSLIFFEQAKIHYQLGNMIRSLFLLKEIINVVNDSEVLLLISKIYTKLGYNDKASTYFAKYNQCLNTFFHDYVANDLKPQRVICGDRPEVKIRYQSQFEYENNIPFDPKKIEKEIIFPSHFLKAPIRINDVVGVAAYFLGEQHLGSINIVAAEEIKEVNDKFKNPQDYGESRKAYDSNRFLNNTIALERIYFKIYENS
jgi:Penicillin-binding protein 5, C-terminal domain.